MVKKFLKSLIELNDRVVLTALVMVAALILLLVFGRTVRSNFHLKGTARPAAAETADSK